MSGLSQEFSEGDESSKSKRQQGHAPANGQRLVIQIAEGLPPSDVPHELHEVLRAVGISEIWSPHPDVLPGLFYALVPHAVDIDALIAGIRGLTSVRYVERDELQGSM